MEKELVGIPEPAFVAAPSAAIIAAAPDMLAVLREMFVEGAVHVALAGNPIACDALEARARAAIAKATGQ